MPKREEKTIAKNRRAFHDYEILETYEAGIELTGTEVRSLRENNCQLTDCFALIRNGEVWLNNVHISPYSNGSIFNPDPDRHPEAPTGCPSAIAPPFTFKISELKPNSFCTATD